MAGRPRLPGGPGDAHKMAVMRALRGSYIRGAAPVAAHAGKVGEKRREAVKVRNGMRYGDYMRARHSATGEE